MPRPKPKKLGRPLLPKGAAREKITPIRLQDDEREAFERAAKKSGVTLSEWIRQSLKAAIQSK